MVSVCIATYNGAKYINKQIDSILTQLCEKDEIIISDDHSTDGTLDVVKSYEDKRIKCYFNEKEKGYTSNFENALEKSVGDFIFLCDQDDIWLSNKLEFCLEHLEHYDFIVSDAILVNEMEVKVKESFYRERHVYTSFWGNVFKFGYLGCCMAFRKNVKEKALPFPKNHIYCTHDNWIFLIAKLYFKVKILEEPLIKYRRHSSNTSTGGFTNRTSLIFKLKYRCYLLYHLLKRHS